MKRARPDLVRLAASVLAGAAAVVPQPAATASLFADAEEGALGRIVSRWAERHLADSLLVPVGALEVWQWIGVVVLTAAAFLLGFLIVSLGRAVARRVVRRTEAEWDDELVEAMTGPGRLLMALTLFAWLSRALALEEQARVVLDQVLLTLLVLILTWLGLRAVSFLAGLMERSIASRSTDPLRARSAQTQVMVLRRVAGFGVILVGGAVVLLQFDALQSIGTSVLASAGVLGIILGIAAQRSFGTVIAGIQLSITQPIRVGDVVIVEGEWGTVEEIALSYVVVKIWDLRRLVVPISHFLDKPFQNWTRHQSKLLGTVYLHADYRVPVDKVREEVERFVPTREEWDGDVVNLQVTDATDRTVVLRALASAPDSGQAWDLRCAIREHLIGFLQDLEGGRYLPRARVEAEVEQTGERVEAA